MPGGWIRYDGVGNKIPNISYISKKTDLQFYDGESGTG